MLKTAGSARTTVKPTPPRTNVDDSKAIFVAIGGQLAAEATLTGQPVEVSFTLPHPDVQILAQWGTDLTINECNDVFMGEPVVNGEAFAIEYLDCHERRVRRSAPRDHC